MFERFDPDARVVAEDAIAEARRLRHGYLGTEHLLMAYVSRGSLMPGAVRDRLPVSAERVREEFDRTAASPAGASDEALLATLGIDLNEIRRRAEAAFGLAALDRAAIRPRRPWRRERRCFPMLADGLGVMPRVKRALERAGEREPGLVSATGLLLAVLEDDEAMATQMLAGLGVDVVALRVALANAIDA